MEGSISLTKNQRKVLLQNYRAGRSARISRRCHVILLRADGWTWQQIQGVLLCSTDLISETLRKFIAGGLSAVLDDVLPIDEIPEWLELILRWLSEKTPQDFGYFRTRWSCEILANLLAWETGIRVSTETIRRSLRRVGYVWRRPRPVVGPVDPRFAEKFQQIQRLLRDLPADEVAVFQDEVDINLNPKIGSMWMVKGRQAEVVTPGNNRKCYVAGSLVWSTGTLLVSDPQAQRNTKLFLTHLEDLRYRLRCWKTIHVICDNAAFHKSQAVHDYLTRHGERIRLHYLPAYAPETNPIERVWWHLHETVTRNHRCENLEDLVQQALRWFTVNNNHYLDMRRSLARVA